MFSVFGQFPYSIKSVFTVEVFLPTGAVTLPAARGQWCEGLSRCPKDDLIYLFVGSLIIHLTVLLKYCQMC